MLKRKREMVEGLIAFHLEQYHASGAELIIGSAHVVAPKTVELFEPETMPVFGLGPTPFTSQHVRFARG